MLNFIVFSELIHYVFNLKKGFTLLELLLVITVIAMLAGIILIALNPAQRINDAQNARYLAKANDLEKAIQAYTVANNGSLPTNLANLNTYGLYDICKTGQSSGCINLDQLTSTGYISEIPVDDNTDTAALSGFKFEYNPGKKNVEIFTSSEYTKYVNTGTTLSKGLIGWWKMDESSWNGTAGEVIDSSGYNNHGTSVSSPTIVTGRFGNAGDFNGSSSYITVADNSILEPAYGLSLSVWLKREGGVGTRQIFLGKGDGQTNATSQYWMELNTSNQLVFYTSTSSSGGSFAATDKTITDTTQWHHVVMTWDGTTAKIFLDGQQSSVTSGRTGTLVNTTYAYGIGKLGAFTGLHFNGLLDDSRIYDRALNADEITIMNAMGPDPIAYWKLDEGAGTNAANSIVGGASGTLGSSTAAPAWHAGGNCKKGSCLYFDGGDYVNTNTDFSWDETNKASIMFWMKPVNTTDISKGLIGKQNSLWEWSIYQTNSSLNLVYWNSVGGHTNGMDNGWGNVLQANHWMHAAYTWDGSTSKFYSDGVLRTTHTATNPTLNQDRTNFVMLGGNIYTWGDSYFTGYMDEIKFYNYEVNAAQIAQDMNI